MSLCFACDEVVRGLFQKSKYSARGYFGDVWRMANIPYSGTLWDVLSTAESCRLCGLIKACFLEEHKSKFESTKHTCLEESLESRYVRDMSISAILEGGVVSHQSPDALKLTILKFLFPTKTSESDPHDYLHFSIWAERASPAGLSGDVSDTGPLQNYDSEEAFSRIRRWLSWCLENHDMCKSTISGTIIDESIEPLLPTRVVEISSDVPKLLITNGRRGHYVAFSHCWGPPGKHPLRTTTGNLQEHISGIPWKSLPKSFQDALKITRELGMDYIWIDSLCIIQDSEEDWRQESKEMGLIYERARLTIAAAGAADPSEGCFILDRQMELSIELPYYEASGRRHGSFRISRSVGSGEPFRSPLRRRAWATQEWKLSRRRVNYMRAGISWVCKIEIDPDGSSDANRAIDEMGTPFDAEEYNGWMNLVKDYSGCLLTYEKDRLIALEGLVTEMQKVRKDKYCSGIWSDELPDLLLWAGNSRERNKCLPSVPSWTWASILGEVTFLVQEVDEHKAENMCRHITLESSGKLVITSLAKDGQREGLHQHRWSDEECERNSGPEPSAQARESSIIVDILGEEDQGDASSIAESESNIADNSSFLDGSLSGSSNALSDLLYAGNRGSTTDFNLFSDLLFDRRLRFNSTTKVNPINHLSGSIPFTISFRRSSKTTGLAIFDIPEEAENTTKFLCLFLMKQVYEGEKYDDSEKKHDKNDEDKNEDEENGDEDKEDVDDNDNDEDDYRNGEEFEYMALLLEPASSEAGTYRRIGVGIIRSDQLLEGATSQQVTII